MPYAIVFLFTVWRFFKQKSSLTRIKSGAWPLTCSYLHYFFWYPQELTRKPCPLWDCWITCSYLHYFGQWLFDWLLAVFYNVVFVIHSTVLHIQDDSYGIVSDNHKQDILLARFSEYPNISVDRFYLLRSFSSSMFAYLLDGILYHYNIFDFLHVDYIEKCRHNADR